MGYSTLSADLAPPALCRLHSVIFDFRPPSVTESGEAALRRLLPSRAIGGYSLTSDDPARESPYLDASKKHMLRPETGVADMETRLEPHSRLHYAGSVSVLVKAGSVQFVEAAVEYVGLFCVAKKARAQRFITRVNLPSGPVPTGEGIGQVVSQGNWFVGSADTKNAFHQKHILGWLKAFFALSTVLASRSWLHWKNGQPRTSCCLQHFRWLSPG